MKKTIYISSLTLAPMRTGALKAITCYSMLTLLAVSPVLADNSYPGAANNHGTVLNAVQTAPAPTAAAALQPENNRGGIDLGAVFDNLFSRDEEEAQPVAQAQPAASHAALSAHDIAALGEPDSSPALYAARQELDHVTAAPVAVEPAAAPVTPVASIQPAAVQPQPVAQPIAPIASQVTPQAPAPLVASPAPAPIMAPAPAAPVVVAQAEENQSVQPIPTMPVEVATQANAPVAEANAAHAVEAPDNSPARFSERRELEPVKDGNKITNMLTSLMKPITGETETAQIDGKIVETTPLASYESPGIVVKKESLKQTSYQPELTQREIELAAMNPASGTASDGGPLIQLPDVPPPVVPSEANKLVPKPVVKAPAPEIAPAPKPVVKAPEPTEPKQQLSPATKAVLNKIPANIDSPVKKTKEPIAVDRAKSSDPASSAVSATSVKHEEMGIKIEVNAPKMDMNYELEKAYNAVTAGQTETAMGIYKSILQNDPKNKGALFGLGTLYHRSGQLDAARKLYSELLNIDPDNRDALNNFLVLMADEAPEAALDQLSRLEKRDPKFSPIPAQMAIIYQKMGDMDKASEKMFRAVDLAPENLVYRYNLAIMLDKQQKYDEAGKLYQQILQAYQRGETIPGNIQQIQQRLTYISANKP